MARTLKFKQGDSGTELDLLAGSGSGWNVQSWFPQTGVPVAAGEGEPVQEEMICLVEGSSQNDLASDLQAMAEMRWYAAQYLALQNWVDPVWLHFKTDDESTGVRALVLNSEEYPFEMEFMSQPSRQTGLIEEDKAKVRISFWRMPFWERLTVRDLPTSTNIVLHFDSGSTAPTAGEEISGHTSGAEAVVAYYVLASGTWGGGDAAGWMYLMRWDGTAFQDNEQLDGQTGLGGNNFATANGTEKGSIVAVYDYTMADGDGVPGARDLQGDVAARIRNLGFAPQANSVSLARLWVGLRSDAVAGSDEAYEFIPVWELEDGSSEDDDVAAATDGSDDCSPEGGSGTDHVHVDDDRGGGSATDWDDGDFHVAWSIELEDVVDGTEQAQFGLILHLLRAKAGSSTTWEVQLRFGYDTMDKDEFQEGVLIAEVDQTSWDLYAMGIHPVPLRNLNAFDLSYLDAADEAGFEIQVWARRTSGSGDLYMDCLVCIPVDEGYLIVRGSDAYATNEAAFYGQGPMGWDQVVLYKSSISHVIQFLDYEAFNFRLPPGDGRLFAAYARGGSSDVADMMTVGANSAFFERWVSLRGAE